MRCTLSKIGASASVGDATTLALWGFATGTWIAGTVIGGAFSLSYSIDLFPVLLVFADVGQFIGGLFAFDRANTFAGTAFCSYGAFNVSVATYFLLQAHGVIPEAGASRVLLGFVLRASPTSRLC